ncbi:MAG TPA: ATP-binding protein [Candidatus Vogelbacteria bacterium]|nr:ATP-binding protein [Candidatus Vogelbacteria bacterium]
MKKRIFKRKIIDEILKYLDTGDIVVLHGARQVGKTSIMYWLRDYLINDNKITHYIDLEDSRMVDILNSGPEGFLNYLKGEGFLLEQRKTFVFIDEIQYLDNPSEFLKLIADHHKYLKLIVSGSSSFEIKNKFKDSLVGRTVNFEIFNLSFSEYLLFNNYHFDKKITTTDKKIDELKSFFKDYILYGGYPKIVLTAEVEMKEKYLQQIIDTYVRRDIRDLAEIKEIEKFNKLLEILAVQSGQLLNISELSNTCDLSKTTIEKYLFILENTYILKLVKPYYNNIRSELFKTPKIYFYDSGLMQMLRYRGLQKKITGSALETAIYSELVKNFDQDNVFYWRTKDRKEIDFILRKKNNIIVPVEIKFNFSGFKSEAMNYFIKHYNINEYLVIGLSGKKDRKEFIYPWEF